MSFDRFLVVGARDTRSEHGKGWLRNREFEPKSNRHDTPPTFPIDLWPEVLRVLRPPQPRRPFLLFHPAPYARVLARRKAKLSCERFSATSTRLFTPISRSPFVLCLLPLTVCAPFTPSRENRGTNKPSLRH